MARESKADRLLRIHREALQRFGRISEATRDDRLQSREDRRFVSVPGAQWEGPLEAQFANKPRFELNKIAGAIARLEGDHRANRVTVDFLPRDGTPRSDVADVADGLFRSDEQDSNADEAYDNAFTEAVSGGFGAIRLRVEHEDDESEEDADDLRIRIEPITDADTSVFFDLNSKRKDKSDARFAFLVTPMTHDAYLDEWGDDPASWPKDVLDNLSQDWYTPAVVYVAEYYVVEKVKEPYTCFKTPLGEEIEKTDEELDYVDEDESEDERGPTLRERLKLEGAVEVDRGVDHVKRVHKYIMSGRAVLEDCGIIAGKRIPIAPVYGKRVYIDNKERWQGHVRLAKDAQRIANMLTSKLAEISAMSPVEKPIFAPEQIDGFQREWADDNIANHAYLRVNPLMNSDGSMAAGGPLGYTKAPAIPPALGGLLQFVSQDMKDILGSAQDQEKVVANISGKAVEMLQQGMDRLTAIYLDNFKQGMKCVGEIWKSMARDVYVTKGRRLKVVAADGTRASVVVGAPGLDEEGVPLKGGRNNIAEEDLDVVVDVGPSTVTKRAATVRALTGMLAIIPQDDVATRQVITAAALANMEGEGLADIQDFFRRQLVRQGVIKPTEQEQQELMQEQQAKGAMPPDPQTQTLLAMAQKEANLAEKAKADTMRTLADTQLTQAKIKQTEASTLATIAKVDAETKQQVVVAVPTR
jgi:hypothetical protein